MDRNAGLSTVTRGAYDHQAVNHVDAPRVNGVQAYTNDIDKALEECHSCLSSLITRIESILRPSPPNGDSAGTAPCRSMESPLAERQVAHKAALSALYDRIDATIQRVDL